MQNMFCYLKGIVECAVGTVQDCNNKRTVVCPLEIDNNKLNEILKQNMKPKETVREIMKEKHQAEKKEHGFCFLKGMVGCSPGRIQDCNIKRVAVCPKE